jgi:hypothetical protein
MCRAGPIAGTLRNPQEDGPIGGGRGSKVDAGHGGMGLEN